MKRSREVRLIQESTLFNAPTSESTFGSKFPSMSDIPISPKLILAENRAKRLKVIEEAEKTHVQVISPLRFKIKWNSTSEQNVDPELLSLSFFESSTSPEEIKAVLGSKLYQMKSDLVSALKKMDMSLGCEVAAKIEFDGVDKSDETNVYNKEDP